VSQPRSVIGGTDNDVADSKSQRRALRSSDTAIPCSDSPFGAMYVEDIGDIEVAEQAETVAKM